MADAACQLEELEGEFAGLALCAIRAGVPMEAVFARHFDESGRPRAPEGSSEYASLFRAAIEDTKAAALRHGTSRDAIRRWSGKQPKDVLIEAERLLDGFDGWTLTEREGNK